jgi:DNA-directed RNA polymerase subunit E'/Rpb7
VLQGLCWDRSITHLSEETTPPATEDETPSEAAEQPAPEPSAGSAEAPQATSQNGETPADAATEAGGTTATAATAVAVEEPPAAESSGAEVKEATAEADEAAAPSEASPAEEPATVVAEEPQTGNGSAEPMTMAELLEQPDVEVKSLKHGDVVEGTVVRIDPDEILVDFGGKSEGVVSNRELIGRRGGRDGDDSRPEIKVGDEVLVYVLQPESPEGHAVLSLRRAGLERKWRAMQERFESGEIVEARVIDHNKGGLIVDLGVRGFVPISQIVDFPRRPRDEQPRDAAQEIAEKLQPFVGRTLRLKILEVNRKANRLILSEKVALYEERREKRDELFSSLQVGQRVKGTVRSIAPFGVFIDLGGIDGSSTRASFRGTRSTTRRPRTPSAMRSRPRLSTSTMSAAGSASRSDACSPIRGRSRSPSTRSVMSSRGPSPSWSTSAHSFGSRRGSRASSTSVSCRTSASPILATS